MTRLRTLFGTMFLAIAIAGCAHKPRFITVPCIAPEQQIPAEPPRVADKLTGKADEDVRVIAGSALRLRVWGSALRDIVEGCRA